MQFPFVQKQDSEQFAMQHLQVWGHLHSCRVTFPKTSEKLKEILWYITLKAMVKQVLHFLVSLSFSCLEGGKVMLTYN